MTALKPKTKQSAAKRKMVGTFLSQPTSELVHLYAFAYEKPIATVVENVLEEWAVSKKGLIEPMVGLISSRAAAEYKETAQSEKPLYLEGLQKKLSSKLISQEVITDILKRVTDGEK